MPHWGNTPRAPIFTTKEPWMKDQDRILKMIVDTAVLLISRPALSPDGEGNA